MANSNPIQVEKYLKGIDYPASRQDLCEHAQEQGADEQVINFLERIPDRDYEGPAGVNEEIGHLQDHSGNSQL